MAESAIELTLGQARALQLAAQGLLRPPARRAKKADVLAAIRRMGALQIDTISVVARSPYLVLWSRLGDYEPRWLDELLAEGRLFEYWAHEACFLPIEDFALMRHRMLDPESMGWKYHAASQESSLVASVLAAIRERGPLRSADFQRPDHKSGGWWQWKGEKRILENLLTAGELMIARRQAFQRVYDLRERVLPEWNDERLPSREETDRAIALASVRALGVARGAWVADYYRASKRATPAIVDSLAQEGALLRVRVQGLKTDAFVHPDHGALLEDAAAGRLRATCTTLLSPFDPIVWDRARALELFAFDYRLECYTPAPKRVYGYYVLPILRRGALVGRLDAKAHRRSGEFEVKKVVLEEGVPPSDALVRDLADTLRRCAQWHGTPELVIRSGRPIELVRALKKELK